MPVDNPARVHEVVDAVIAEINARIAAKEEGGADIDPPRFTATAKFVAAYTLPDLKILRVDVRSPAKATDLESRGGSTEQYVVEVIVQQAVNGSDETACRLLVDLADRICRLYYVTRTIGQNGDSGEPGTTYGAVQPDTVQVAANDHTEFNPDLLAKGRFYSVITITFVEYRSR